MVKAIIFDLWETLGDKKIGIGSTLREHFNIEKTFDYAKRYCNSIQNQTWDSYEAMARSFLDEFNIEDTQENRNFVITTIKTGIEKARLFDKMKELLEKLNEHYKLGLISDTTNFEAAVLEKWNITTLFDAAVWSFESGLQKDCIGNFELIAKKLSVEPQECLFIDNNYDNIKWAQKAGMQGIVFESVEQVKQDLQQCGVRL